MPQGRYIDDESFKRLLQRAVIFPLLLAIGMAAIFLWQVRGLLQVNRWVDEGDRIIAKAEHLQLSLTELETRMRGFIIFGSDRYLELTRETEKNLPQEFSGLKEMMIASPEQVAKISEIEKNTNLWIATSEDAIQRRVHGKTLQNFVPNGSGIPFMNEVRKSMRSLIATEVEIRNDRFASARRTSRYVMLFGILLASALGIVLAVFSRRALFRLSQSYQGAFSGLEQKTQELQVSEARFRHLADAIPQIVWTAKVGSGQVDYVNQRWFEYTGQKNKYDWVAAVHPEDFGAAFGALKSAGEVRGIFQAEYRLRQGKDDTYRWHLGRAVPVHDERGELNYWFGTATDIEDQKRAHKNVEQALKLRDEFISVASHELRTPLTSLKLQLQMAKREINKNADIALIEKNVQFSLSQVDRLTNLVEKMLDISRIQTGRLTFEMENTNLSEMVTDIAEKFRGEFEDVGCALTLDIQPEVTTNCDRFRLEQVIVNLLTNAMKYGPGKPVHLVLKKKGLDVVLAVEDHGSGIPLDQQSRIFERFERAGATKNVDGIGLGLYIAKEVVDAHGGKITVKSDGESGSVFTVELMG